MVSRPREKIEFRACVSLHRDDRKWYWIVRVRHRAGECGSGGLR